MVVLAQDLRKAILQAAIQGKLTEQLPEDGEAIELLDKIKKEKNTLIKENKIKKEPKLNLSVGRQFEIPQNWIWCQVGELVTYKNGYSFKPSETTKRITEYPVIKSQNIMTLTTQIKKNNDFIEKPTTKMLDSLIRKGDLLMCLSSQSSNPEPLGKTAIYDLDYKALLNQRVLKMTPVNPATTKYLYYLFNTEYFHFGVSHQGNGLAQANLKLEHVREMYVSLPPLAEQERIVDRIEALMGKIDEYEKLEYQLVELKKNFPEEMKNALLKAAIQGKLTTQLPEEGDARVLLEEIKNEKERLIKDKKIKKEKSLPPITDDELPFDIPESWSFIRLQDVGDWGSGATPLKSDSTFYKNGTIPWLLTGDLNNGFIYEKDIKNKITNIALSKTSVRLNPVDSVLIAMYGATIGKLGILKTEATTNQACCACKPFFGVNNLYLFRFLMAYKQQLIAQGEGGAQPNISKEKIIRTVMPLPPLAEQKRIVAKLDQLLPLCESLSILS